MRLFKNILSLTFLNGLTYIFPLLIAPFLIRVLGVDEYRYIVEGLGLLALGYVVCNFAADFFGVERVARNANRHLICSMYLSGITYIRLVLAILFSGSCLLYIYMFRTSLAAEQQLVVALFILPILAQAFQPLWLARAYELFKQTALTAVLTKTINLVLILLLVKNGADAFWVPVIMGATLALNGFIIFTICQKHFRVGFIRLKRSLFVLIAKSGSSFYNSRLALAVISNGPVLLISNFASASEISYYGVFDQGLRAAKQLFSSVSVAMFPFMAKKKDIALYWRVFTANLFLLVVCGGLGWLLSDWLITYLVGEVTEGVSALFGWFIITFMMGVLNAITGYPLFTIFNQTNKVNNSIYLGLLVFVISIVVLHPDVNAEQMIIIVLLSEGAMMLLRLGSGVRTSIIQSRKTS